MSKEKKEKCGCNDNCTCGDDCNCTQENKCSEDCTCGEHEHHDCGCGDDCNCTQENKCSEDCTCGEHEHHDCGCGDDCDCKEPKSPEEIIAMYEKAFGQFEEALNKVDAELEKEKKRAEENEHIARVYRQDLERYKERNKNSEQEFKEKAKTETALKLLPVLDDFEKAFASSTDNQTTKGFEMIYKSLKGAVEELGIEEIESLNQEFNPEFHDCISKVKAEKKNQAGLVSRVFVKGYKYRGEDGKVIRHSVVEIYE
ncbi:MAG: nucleotide exchange factor GrpE [Clostridia bacterium]|nr:nucleotide exchange factor GrpE [Clostridia bacterium]